ncbi:class I SAM-dependent methyltransferase [Mucilaginibacter sp. RS28]|uniref:Class I SAM-dependent methyltransferase n=1 Tax=Mucilaginibacter straminoryzae TaxID=2932774 RepID=A0A9X2BCB0_9SPHI|nr:class I SAM-dependent methyltransferase [Mucilaginibacter straminoryzae]MCJ8210722.1 class I SAM-dependent methyltransferase [Mucilaginibacter straminoryzae]
MNILTSLLDLAAKPKRLRSLLSFNGKGYLNEIGWFNAFDNQKPVDAEGNPIPWVTYSFIDFIKDRIGKQHAIFEFGSGNSTFFYAKSAGIVVSVEHDKGWYETILNNRPENSEIIFCELHKDGDYCRMPVKLGEQFDIIIVDGRDRVNCCKQAVAALSENGVVVLDDSEREFYQPGIDFLKENGFRELPFSGISPGLFYRKSTSIFYKDNNCLGI